MPEEIFKVALLGPPNVGKSVFFNRLCHSYTVVSNYPGTTVELTRGQAHLDSIEIDVIDTPGIYSLNAVTEEEKLTGRLILQEKLDLLIQVADACNLERSLNLTAELIEADLPLVLVINMMDEAERRGIRINAACLSQRLGIPVIITSFIRGIGVKEVINVIRDQVSRRGQVAPVSRPKYPPKIKEYLASVFPIIDKYLPSHVSPRFMSLLLLNPDPKYASKLLQETTGLTGFGRRDKLTTSYGYLQMVNRARREWAGRLIKENYLLPQREKTGMLEWLSELLVHPWFGTVFLILVLYFGFYQLVGVWSAGYLVDYLDQRLFGEIIIPYFEDIVTRIFTTKWLQELFAGPYGLLNLGIRYTFAIILPLVFSFFLVFGFIEDSGYLPRIAYLMNRWLSKVGLNGKAVIPLTLGLGCGTLAVLVTRTLDTRRERLLTLLLLSLVVPCSAQLGLIMGMLAGTGAAVGIWLLVVVLVLILASRLAGLFLGGKTPAFCMEVPPLRTPGPFGVLRKTMARTRWYLKEIIPIFIFTSLLMWAADWTGILDQVVHFCYYPLQAVGLPPEVSLILVLGFVRRDYGAAGLFELARSGVLSLNQVLITGVILTLFVPCLAQLLVMAREQGAAFAVLVVITTALVSWSAAYLLYWGLNTITIL